MRRLVVNEVFTERLKVPNAPNVRAYFLGQEDKFHRIANDKYRPPEDRIEIKYRDSRFNELPSEND
jgi:hypothetical protein